MHFISLEIWKNIYTLLKLIYIAYLKIYYMLAKIKWLISKLPFSKSIGIKYDNTCLTIISCSETMKYVPFYKQILDKTKIN